MTRRNRPKRFPAGVVAVATTGVVLSRARRQTQQKAGVADEARASAGEAEFQITDSLRCTWMASQRTEKELTQFSSERELGSGYRFAGDGLLERQVPLPPPIGSAWVPVVPSGNATANLTWRRWMFLQCHIGVLGAHRNAERTETIISRQAWWPSLRQDVARWWTECLTCLQFQKM